MQSRYICKSNHERPLYTCILIRSNGKTIASFIFQGNISKGILHYDTTLVFNLSEECDANWPTILLALTDGTYYLRQFRNLTYTALLARDYMLGAAVTLLSRVSAMI